MAAQRTCAWWSKEQHTAWRREQSCEQIWPKTWVDHCLLLRSTCCQERRIRS